MNSAVAVATRMIPVVACSSWARGYWCQPVVTLGRVVVGVPDHRPGRPARKEVTEPNRQRVCFCDINWPNVDFATPYIA